VKLDATRYVHYAYAVMCGEQSVMNWSCVYCNRNPSFKPIAFNYNQSTDNSAFYGINHDLKESKIFNF
jgi:hypothetical protein